LQQSAPVSQAWPYWEQPGGLPPSGVPPSGKGGVVVEPQVPEVLPTGRTQVPPGQQSALTVQPPALGTQAGSPGGGMKQRSTPCASGVHGTSLQQSSAEAQVSPASRHSAPRPLQRGTPSVSS
jgi:hypothetical protein